MPYHLTNLPVSSPTNLTAGSSHNHVPAIIVELLTTEAGMLPVGVAEVEEVLGAVGNLAVAVEDLGRHVLLAQETRASSVSIRLFCKWKKGGDSSEEMPVRALGIQLTSLHHQMAEL